MAEISLKLLLDENISPKVFEIATNLRSDINITTIHLWHNQKYINSPDRDILLAAHEEGYTLVTYDKQILSELYLWFQKEVPFSGIIFIDGKTVQNNNFLKIAELLILYWDKYKNENFFMRMDYLR